MSNLSSGLLASFAGAMQGAEQYIKDERDHNRQRSLAEYQADRQDANTRMKYGFEKDLVGLRSDADERKQATMQGYKVGAAEFLEDLKISTEMTMKEKQLGDYDPNSRYRGWGSDSTDKTAVRGALKHTYTIMANSAGEMLAELGAADEFGKVADDLGKVMALVLDEMETARKRNPAVAAKMELWLDTARAWQNEGMRDYGAVEDVMEAFNSFLEERQAMLGDTEGGSAASGPVQIGSDEEYNLLAPGTVFIGPDGKERVKP